MVLLHELAHELAPITYFSKTRTPILTPDKIVELSMPVSRSLRASVLLLALVGCSANKENPAYDGWTWNDRLRVEISVNRQRFCGVGDGSYRQDLSLSARYRNTGKNPIVIFIGSETLGGYVAHTLGAGPDVKPVAKDVSYDFVGGAKAKSTTEHPRLLSSGATAEIELEARLLAGHRYNIDPGPQAVRFSITLKVAEPLRTSQPVVSEISLPSNTVRVDGPPRSFGDCEPSQ